MKRSQKSNLFLRKNSSFLKSLIKFSLSLKSSEKIFVLQKLLNNCNDHKFLLDSNSSLSITRFIICVNEIMFVCLGFKHPHSLLNLFFLNEFLLSISIKLLLIL